MNTININLAVYYYIACIWIFYSLLEGFTEAWHWHYKIQAQDRKKTDAHVYFTLRRFCLWVMLFGIDFRLGMFALFVFPFLHDGAYYHHRNELTPGVYRKGFFDQSSTSTALLTKVFTPYIRVLCFICGILILFL